MVRHYPNPQIKNIPTPHTLTMEPIISMTVTFCRKKIIAGGIIRIGTIDMMVEAMRQIHLNDCLSSSSDKWDLLTLFRHRFDDYFLVTERTYIYFAAKAGETISA